PQWPRFKRIYFDDPRGLRHYAQAQLTSIDSLRAIGREFSERNPEFFGEEIEKGRSSDVAVILYTSGTTGNPKGVSQTHAAMIHTEDAGWVKRRMFQYFMGVAERAGMKILDGKPGVSLKNRLLYALGALLVYGPLKNVLGLSRVRVAYTGGEAIGPDLFDFYRSIGINLKQLYGMTETC